MNDTQGSERPRLDFNEVRAASDGRWDDILERLAGNTLTEALSRPGKKVDCPLPHGGKKDFRLYKDFARNGAAVCSCGRWRGGFELLETIHGWDIKTSMEQVAQVLWGDHRVADKPPMPAKPKHDHNLNRKRRSKHSQIWDETIPLYDTDAQVATAYFNRRGIYWRSLEGLEQALRFHPALEFWDDGELKGKWPAIVAAVMTVDGQLVTLHRIYLDENSLYTGKAKAKKMCPIPDDMSLEGAAIRLGSEQPTLGVSEGIETALAAREATGLTVWPCYCDWMMGAFEPPESVTAVIGFGDRDISEAGLRACNALEERLSSRISIKSFMPGKEGEKLDWNDALMTQGRRAFKPVFDHLNHIETH